MEITDLQRDKIEKIANKFGLELLVLFGSQATGKARKDSDFDVAVRNSYRLRPQGLTREDELEIAVALDAVFPNTEVCDIRKASPLLLGSIGHDGIPLYQSSDTLFSEFKIFAWNQYQDYKPVLAKMRARTAANLREVE